jgi:hypothetical protein
MKRSLLLSAIAIGLYYFFREFLSKNEDKLTPPTKHLTNAFANAKEHAVNWGGE